MCSWCAKLRRRRRRKRRRRRRTRRRRTRRTIANLSLIKSWSTASTLVITDTQTSEKHLNLVIRLLQLKLGLDYIRCVCPSYANETSSVNELNMLSSLDTGYIRGNHLQVVYNWVQWLPERISFGKECIMISTGCNGLAAVYWVCIRHTNGNSFRLASTHLLRPGLARHS